MLATQMSLEVDDEIHILPDECLHQPCEEITLFDDQLTKLAQRMIRVMRGKKGQGLAAPQLGVLQRLIMVDCTCRSATDVESKALILANPHIIQTRGSGERGRGLPVHPQPDVPREPGNVHRGGWGGAYGVTSAVCRLGQRGPVHPARDRSSRRGDDRHGGGSKQSRPNLEYPGSVRLGTVRCPIPTQESVGFSRDARI